MACPTSHLPFGLIRRLHPCRSWHRLCWNNSVQKQCRKDYSTRIGPASKTLSVLERTFFIGRGIIPLNECTPSSQGVLCCCLNHRINQVTMRFNPHRQLSFIPLRNCSLVGFPRWGSVDLTPTCVVGHHPLPQLNSSDTFRGRVRNPRFAVGWYSSQAKKTLSMGDEHLRSYLDERLAKYQNARACLMSEEEKSDEALKKAHAVFVQLEAIGRRLEEHKGKETELEDLCQILQGDDDCEIKEIAKQEKEILMEELSTMEEEILESLVPPERQDSSDIILEVTAGVGGQEAMLFNDEMFDMYESYAASKGWSFKIVEHDSSGIGGLRKATASVSGQNVYGRLKYEAGIHRVQRVPKTEKSGRVHTSTMAVVVLPQPTEIDVQLNPKDLKITTFRSSGAGGQHVNTTESAVRIVHTPTGVVSECQAERSQIRNKEVALQVLRTRLYQEEVKKQTTAQRTSRKLQAGTAARSEKIRTYNFNQDRITDHRIGKNMFNLDTFMAGGEELDEMIDNLIEEDKRDRLVELLEDFHAKKSSQS